ncbi:TOTE conflict system archaeo-eukaryotic primase domain-containing protein [Mucilaginibacter sp. X5P1]|uniref:DEAD/DEAH box helicase n=1 Tax=Mucilaginibacter sp. X5P1 TaxID=2723088 RepID=UPI00180B896C|nr:DEAD/DEAH box helicase [Mucilaginibacter sp. X5P1]MBB6141853.1 superfamily II DNA or RNA helicase [Mucilaginibacter sp. X5P1]
MKEDRLNLYKSLFKGREDVFAIRWEKSGKSSYMPVYNLDPHRYKLHQMKGGTFQTFTDKTYQLLTDDHLIKHLKGEQVVGLYPLLQDNTSWFIAADFDEANWIEECRTFIKICEEYDVPAYLERSRSGKGGHVWIFFEEPYEAFRSRKIMMSLLQKVGVISVFDKNSSFDRLFPNQDYHSKKGLGNLIAIPLNKTSLSNGNSCFIDPETLKPFDDQWAFLKTINRITISQLNYIYKEQTNYDELSAGLFQKEQPITGKLEIILNNEIHINRIGLPASLVSFLKEELNFANNEYQIKKNINKNTFGVKRYFKLLNETSESISIPRGFIGRLLRFCKEQQIDYVLEDQRKKAEPVSFKGSIALREYQLPAQQAATKKDFGIIVAPPGSGKTVLSLAIIKDKQQPALILVHRKQLADQWIERIESFLGIPKKDIGRIGQGKNKPGKHITVAMIQSMEKALESTDSPELINAFGTIIIDECHHVPAETYQRVIGKLNSFYLYGLTATPFRKYNDGKLIFIHLGEIIHEVKAPEVQNQTGTQIIIRDTDLFVPFNTKTDKFETLFKILIHDSARNQLILNDVVPQLNSGKKAVIITERKEHITSLQQYLKQHYDTIALSGEDSDLSKKSKWAAITKGDFQVLITTGQYFGEGTDIQNIECLFLVYPFAFEGKLIQYIGRVQRSEVSPAIYDYRDHKISYLERLFQKRNLYYKKLDQSGLTSPIDESEAVSNQISEKIEVPIEDLEFRFGSIAFKYAVADFNGKEVEFEIENLNIRPEFTVLKPYFIRFLKCTTVLINIRVTLQHNRLVFKSASSKDLNKINRELIESVRFRFLNKEIIKGIPAGEENLLDVVQIQGGNEQLIYTNEDDLLENILALKQYKHHRHLRYLSQKHERTILKLRFVLEPFSFVFLLSGNNQYHLVWETLDTEEATYIWHIEKLAYELDRNIKRIDGLLGQIRSQGRQQYLETNPEQFSRIVHDYSDDNKGFIIWKDLLEERLF